MKFYALLLTVFLFTACEKKNPQPDIISATETVATKDSAAVPLTKQDSLRKMNDEILKTLKAGDLSAFSEFIHPDKGVRFSMYAYTDTLKDKHFSKADFLKYSQTPVKFTWGEKDGTGEPLILSIKDYIAQWVFKKNFTGASYSVNHFQESGNSLNNLQKIYPNADFTENYLKGSEKYSGMDWKTLRFVFEKKNGRYYLTAVINDEWTV